MSEQNNGKVKFFSKPPKGKMTTLFVVFLWIILWNVIYQALHHQLSELPIPIENWSFFICVTVFFMQEELSLMQRFWHTLVGGAVGLFLACAVVGGCTLLAKAGLSSLLAVIIMLVITIGMLILLHPYCPMVFNNVGFIYFIVSLIDSATTIEMLPSNLVSLATGSICLNLGVIGVLTILKTVKAKKASK